MEKAHREPKLRNGTSQVSQGFHTQIVPLTHEIDVVSSMLNKHTIIVALMGGYRHGATQEIAP